MALGVPLELMTMLGSGALSGAMTLWGKSMEVKTKQNEMMLKGMNAELAGYEAARKHDKPAFQFTRRVIALTATAAVIVWPKVIPVFWPEIAVTVGYTEWNPGFLFIGGQDVTTWKALKGLVLTPLDTHLMSAIIGLYFGASVVKNAR